MAIWEQPHCGMEGCPSKSVRPSIAVFIVTGVASIVLARPFFKALDMDMSAGITTPPKFTIDGGLLFFGWLLAILLGATRKHENPIWCFVDSIGIPAVVAVLLGLRGVVGH